MNKVVKSIILFIILTFIIAPRSDEIYFIPVYSTYIIEMSDTELNDIICIPPVIREPREINETFINVNVDYDNDWAFFLINKNNPLPWDYIPEVTVIYKQFTADVRIAGYALQMLSDAEEAGFELMVVSGYRSFEKQQEVIEEYIEVLMKDEGVPYEEALSLTSLEIMPPGASEHNAGIALDILNADYYIHNTKLTDNFDQTPEFDWLYNHSWQYGFIMRYPKDKVDITEILYEPWHYRFVGLKRAEEIFNSGLCLEEYFM